MTEQAPELARLREALLGERASLSDQDEVDQIVAALRPFIKQVWDDGQTAGYQGAHSSLNRWGYIERGTALPNPWCDGDGITCDCDPAHSDQRSALSEGDDHD